MAKYCIYYPKVNPRTREKEAWYETIERRTRFGAELARILRTIAAGGGPNGFQHDGSCNFTGFRSDHEGQP